MVDSGPDRLDPVRQLAAGIDDRRLLELLAALLEVIAQDTAQVLDQTSIARDIADRTSAGDWFANTELREIKADAEYFLLMYKQQRDEIARLRAALQDRLARPTSNSA